MSLDPVPKQLAVSPRSSGRSSPVSRQSRAQAEDESFRKDKSFRRYASGVERALSLFDTALQEWADYISFLGRLSKALQAHPSHITVIPLKVVVANRLAQCLTPSLPSGVHQKALEVYGYIFALIGHDALSQDLPIYLPGLTPTLSFASLAVRPAFLSLLESHLLQVRPTALRPALRATLLALLPGLEEETSEEFERTLRIVDSFKVAVNISRQPEGEQEEGHGDEYFWQCFFLASITSPSRRQGALAYLVRSLPKLGAPFPQKLPLPPNGGAEGGREGAHLSSSIEAVISPEPGLLVRCFAAGLSDEQLLIQRGFLDLLVTHCPLHSVVLQHRVNADDLERLMSAAVGVVTRKDMSLNRRLWTWVLGPDQPAPAETGTLSSPAASPVASPTTPGGSRASSRTQYFEQYGLRHLVRAIDRMIALKSTQPAERARPFRICLSLMDRWEVGGLVIPAILLRALDSVRQYEKTAASKDQFKEVVRSASVFFDGVESGLIWGELLGLLTSAMKPRTTDTQGCIEKLALVRFVITHFNVREEEMLVVHIPMTALALLTILRDADDIQSDGPSDKAQTAPLVMDVAFGIVEALIEMAPGRAFLSGSTTNGSTALGRQKHQWTLRNEEIFSSIRTFYGRDQGNLDLSTPPFSANDTGELLLRESVSLLKAALNSSSSKPGLDIRTRPLVTLLRKVSRPDQSLASDVLSAIQKAVPVLSGPQEPPIPFTSFAALISVIMSFTAGSRLALEASAELHLEELTHSLVRQAWLHLSPSWPKFHVEVVRCLWQLQSAMASNKHFIEAAICTLMVGGDPESPLFCSSVMTARRFAILWTHTIASQSGPADTGVGPKHRSHEGAEQRASGSHSYEVMLTRPLLHVLDGLIQEGSEVSVYTRNWLQTLPTVDRVFHIIIRNLMGFNLLGPHNDGPLISETEKTHPSKVDDHDIDGCFYFFRLLYGVLKCSTGRVWSILANEIFSVDEAEAELLSYRGFENDLPLQTLLAQLCMRALHHHSASGQPAAGNTPLSRLHRMVLSALLEILSNPYAASLAGLELEYPLLDALLLRLNGPDSSTQIPLLDVCSAALKLRMIREPPPPAMTHQRTPSKDTIRSSRLSFSMDQSEKEHRPHGPPPPPPQLVKCLQGGFSSVSSRPVLDRWTSFLTDCLPLYSETIFQVLIPLVESLCSQINQTLKDLTGAFEVPSKDAEVAPESTLIALLNGLEQILAKAHDRLITDEMRFASVKTPDQPQGFFGNMVSGVFASDAPQTRKATANDRLTVLLSFKDTVRMCFTVWSWGGDGIGAVQDPASQASYNYTSLRTRNRARRLLEHLFAAETLECLETMVEIWQRSTTDIRGPGMASVFNLLHVLDGSRPKNTIPAIFNAIYSRTNPTALEPMSKSTLASDLSDIDVVAFLAEYSRSLDDDAMDEIWTDCMTFLRDVLANPFPHRQTLPKLLEFTAILGEKVDNTNFGEHRRMRREMSDVFVRLLAAMFTTKPMGFSQDTPQPPSEKEELKRHESSEQRTVARPDDVVAILGGIVPNLPKILSESDRVLGTATSISTGVIGPAFKAKIFPENISWAVLELLYQISKLPNAQKSWRKDIGEAFNHQRFFASPVSLVKSSWLPLLHQWALGDKDRMPELLSRLTPPTTAGIVFGVGASSARTEADRKTQLNLRRIATLILAAADDTFVVNMAGVEEKLIELLTSTAASSPSSATRAEVYMVVRALILKSTAVHLAPLWPIINAELQAAISSVLPGGDSDLYGQLPVLQACKLLDALLVMAPDEFQLHEWLYITDTIDAVYRPPAWHPTALIDEVSAELGTLTSPQHQQGEQAALGQHNKGPSRRRPLLRADGRDVARADLLERVLKPFFSQLSIHAFESTYSMETPDRQACEDSLLADLFDESAIIGSQ